MRVSRKRHTAANVESLRRDVETDVHTINLDQLLKNLDTDRLNGLTTTQAKILLQKNGANRLTPPKETPEIYKLIHSLCGGFSLLIWVGAILCFANYLVESNLKENGSSDHLWLGMVLLTLIFVTGIFSYYQNAKSSKIMASFKQLLPERAAVIRDGERKEISVMELVVGDIVILQTGNQIPADIRIFECQGMKVDNASLTGENIPVPRSAQVSTVPFLEAKNMAFFSSNVVEGLGKGVVVGCGDQTAMGRVAGLTSRLKPRETPISTEIKWFMRYISCWAVFLGILFFGMSLTLGYTWIDAMVFLIGIIVANVPEGLLATVTVSLTLTAKRMASKNCLVKNLESVETLGSTSVICSDKTGTLTQNKMTVRHLWYNGQLREVMASDTWRRYIDSPGFSEMARIASLCNRAEWASPPPGPPLPLNKRKILGDASETALLRCMEVLVKGGAETYRSDYVKVFEVPFNSTDKFQANIHLRDRSHFISLKGAPESVLSRCSTVANGLTTSNLEDKTRDAYTKACQLLANNGERVLGFADFHLPQEDFPPGFDFQTDPQNFPLENLRLVGLISMMDPPRPGVADAVYRCRCAGIKVIMVTGDHPDTARAIAKFVGIITDSDESSTSVNSHSIVITGTELRELEPLDLDKVIKSVSEIVFARTSPVQKLQIVESCQRLHHITAVTGDGVNDSPALKKADVGIAMGIGAKTYPIIAKLVSVMENIDVSGIMPFVNLFSVTDIIFAIFGCVFAEKLGSDVSRQVADIILLDDNFSSITTGIEEGRRIFDNLKSSIAYTLASNVPEIVPFLIFIILGIPLPVGIICVLCIDLGTDMWPAISLAYEKPESDIMSRMPRIPHVDHLVSRKLVFMAYGQIGIIETAAGFFSYLMIMAEHGFLPGKLIGLRPSWDSKAINDLEDSYGQEWTYDDRKVLEYTCHTAFFVSIVIVQWVDVVICKTRRASIFRHGMNNWVLNFSLIFETGVALFVSYAPHMDLVLKTYPLRPEWWLYPVPFAILIFAYDELRKMWIRNNPGGWWDRETSY